MRGSAVLTGLRPKLRGRAKNTCQSDVYSYGVVLTEIASRRNPYDEEVYQQMSLKEFLRALATDATVRPTYPQGTTPAEFSEIVEACLRRDPARRPSFAAIVDLLEAWLPCSIAVAEQ
eukprot:Opistho-1_new@10210